MEGDGEKEGKEKEKEKKKRREKKKDRKRHCENVTCRQMKLQGKLIKSFENRMQKTHGKNEMRRMMAFRSCIS